MATTNTGSARPANRTLRTAGAGVLRSTALALALGSGLPAVAGEGDINTATDRRGRPRPLQTAQFQLPAPAKEGEAPVLDFSKQLTYQYFIGVDPEFVYRNHYNLDNRFPDKSFTWLPSTSGIFTYRPNDWLETTVELQFEHPQTIREQNPLTHPNGTVEFQPSKNSSFLIDQANFTIKQFTAPFEISIGRKGFEDERRSLLDGSMDSVSAFIRQDRFTGRVLFGRLVRWDWDLARRNRQDKDRIDTFYSYGDYRVTDNLKLAAYGIVRHDKTGREGTPITMGMRAFGTPSAEMNYWADIALQRGKDELSKPIRARQYDFGVTRRFFGIPLNPNFTLGWAMGTGEDNPNGSVNHTFHPTNLGSNERRFAGVPQFLVFGETFDPDLSNLKILTVGFGIKPDSQVSFDLVWHKYRLHRLHGPLRSSISADPNQVDSALSNDLGTEWDLVLGFRNFLGVRRLSMDLRMGWFLPGKAFVTNSGTDEQIVLRNPDKATSAIFIIEYRFF